MKTTMYPIQNVSCEACEKLISRLLRPFPGAKILEISSDGKRLTIECSESDEKTIQERLREYHYLDEGLSASPFFSVVRKIAGGDSSFRAEHLLVRDALLSLVVLYLVTGGFYLYFLPGSPLFSISLPLFILLPIGLASTTLALQHVRPLRVHLTCQNAMMGGMIIGMIPGFMVGALIGATNGMFVGSVAGMGVGMGLSSYVMRKNGVMGVLEGLMAGLMSGTMGAMLSVMMLADNLIPFLFLLFASCLLILGGMSYFVLREVGPLREDGKRVSILVQLVLQLFVLFFLLVLMVWGPKSPIAWGAFP